MAARLNKQVFLRCFGSRGGLGIRGVVIQVQIGLKYCYLSVEVKDGSSNPSLG